jgi:hypothetical protein
MLVHRLGVCLDEARFEELRALFVEDASATTAGRTAEGIDAVIAQASRNHSADDQIQHVVSNVLVDLDGGRATVRANLLATFVRRAGGPDGRYSLGEVYRFGAVRTASGWRLTRVATTPVWDSRPPAAP